MKFNLKGFRAWREAKVKDEIKAEFIIFNNDSNFVSGVVDGKYIFKAQLFDESSKYGIDNGRVSRLEIWDGSERIVEYDRGWNIKPKESVKPYYNAVMSLLESAPKRFDKTFT